jgi:hypothetical protein
MKLGTHMDGALGVGATHDIAHFSAWQPPAIQAAMEKVLMLVTDIELRQQQIEIFVPATTMNECKMVTTA